VAKAASVSAAPQSSKTGLDITLQTLSALVSLPRRTWVRSRIWTVA